MLPKIKDAIQVSNVYAMFKANKVFIDQIDAKGAKMIINTAKKRTTNNLTMI